MLPNPRMDLFSADEIAAAAGVSEHVVVAAIGGSDALLPFADAARVGRALVAQRGGAAHQPLALFTIFGASVAPARSKSMPLVVSSTLHLTVLAVSILIATLGLAPKAAALRADDRRADQMRLVFVATPGPGGGGGGGGLLQKKPAPKALREGRAKISSPIPVRQPPKPVVPVPAPPEPKPKPLNAEQLPPIVAPIVAVPSDTRSRVGVLEQSPAPADSHGSGQGGGAGTGTSTGIGEGEGAGIGAGSGGGIGGGPYRPGSGIDPPRLLREVKADYTEEARRRSVAGEVVLEIVVRRDGSVGDVKVLKGLGSGLDDRAAQAVRQWRFAPAQRRGAPVDVIVEVSVEFRLR